MSNSHGRVAFITGAARGIGAETARTLAGSGWSVILTDICADIDVLNYSMGTKDELDAVAAACGANSMALVADVRDQASLDAAVALGVEAFGGIDAVLAGAGVVAGGTAAWDLSEEMWQTNTDINLSGVWRTAKATVPYMLKRPKPRNGRFVAIASAAGMRGNPTISDYTAAKHGVIGFVRSLALELGTRGITANAVAPGSTRTSILDASAAVYDLADVEEFVVHHPIGRLLEPSEIARVIAMLCSPDSGGITGAVFPVDGGMTV